MSQMIGDDKLKRCASLCLAQRLAGGDMEQSLSSRETSVLAGKQFYDERVMRRFDYHHSLPIAGSCSSGRSVWVPFVMVSLLVQ